jgi:hypothetical protein
MFLGVFFTQIMTRLRCKLENGEALFYLAKQVGIDEYILLTQNIDVL